MRYADDDSLTGLDTARRGRRAPRRWTGTRSQRVRAAGGVPQAVFKISSYSRSGGAVMGRFEYITREGEVEAEGPNGERLGQAELAQMGEEWSAEAAARGTRQYAMSAVLSFPAGVDEEQATEAARQFFRAAFADNHDYVFAGHRDTNNYHVHVVVQSAGLDGKQLRIRRDDLQDLRLLMAEKAAEQGIELDASPRWARGLEQERRPGVKIEGMMRRFQSPEEALERAWLLGVARRTQLEALAAVRGGSDADRPVSPLEYARAGECLVTLAQGQEESAEQVQTMKAGVELTRLGLTLSARAEREAHITAAEGAAVLAVATQVDKDLNAQISALSEAPVARREALSARQPLADHLAALRPPPERRWAREVEAPAAAEQAPAVQALEYAREAERVAGQLDTLTHDQDRVAAVKGAVSLARFGWELAERDQAPTPEQAQTRATIDTTERALRAAINQIEDPQAKREAIQARATLYHGGVKEYRQQRREQEREARAERNPQQEEVEYERTRPGPDHDPGRAGVEREGGEVGGDARGVGAGGLRGADHRLGAERGEGRGAEPAERAAIGPGARDVAGGDAESAQQPLGRARPHRDPDRGISGAEPAAGTPARAVVSEVEPGPVAGGGGERADSAARELGRGGDLRRSGAARDGAGRDGGSTREASGVVERGDGSAAGADSEAVGGAASEAGRSEERRQVAEAAAEREARQAVREQMAATREARESVRAQRAAERAARQKERARQRERERERDTGPELEP